MATMKYYYITFVCIIYFGCSSQNSQKLIGVENGSLMYDEIEDGDERIYFYQVDANVAGRLNDRYPDVHISLIKEGKYWVTSSTLIPELEKER